MREYIYNGLIGGGFILTLS